MKVIKMISSLARISPSCR